MELISHFIDGKLYSDKSCNKGELFPDLMFPGEWRDFKKKHNLKFE